MQTIEEKREKRKEYRLANKEKIAVKDKIYSMANKEKISAYMKKRYADNKEEARAANKVWRMANKGKIAAQQKKWREENLGKAQSYSKNYHEKTGRERYLKRNYGITPEVFAAMAEAQEYRCANPACRTDNPGPKGVWNVDHDHKTDAVRGLLCWRCNITLGHVCDDEVMLQGLIDYLGKFK